MAEVIREQDRRSTLRNLITDDFFGDTLSDLGRKWLGSVGLNPAGELAIVGGWIWNVMRLLNVREDISREDDSLPVALQEPSESGPRADATIGHNDFDSMLDTYYRRYGRTVDDVPTAQTTNRLGLAAFTDDFNTLDD